MPVRAQRRQTLASRLESLKVDGLLITFLPNVRYLTGFTGSNAVLGISADPSQATMWTDTRYEVQARQQVDCRAKALKTGAGLWDAAIKWIKRQGLKRIGVEGSRMNVEQFNALATQLGKGFTLIPVGREVERLRMIKTPAEVEAISHSVQINSVAYASALARFKPGMSERDLAAEIDYQMRRAGAEDNAFDTIVASGARSALPHARPSAAPIEPNRLLLIDMGALHEGYASDMTRVVVPGRITPESKRLYAAVLEAQLAAIDAVKPGVKASAIDAAARKALKQHNLDGLVKHSTGHGLGLEIHEAPRLGKRETERLEAGMAITIEPGAYKEGFGGVRIEDTVLVTETGCRILTPTAKQLVAI